MCQHKILINSVASGLIKIMNFSFFSIFQKNSKRFSEMLIKHIYTYELLKQMIRGSKKLYKLVFTNIKLQKYN